LQEIARRIGDNHSTVERLYRGYKVLQQAETSGIFDRGDIVRNRFYFSHLYTAIDYPEFQNFLGIDDAHFADTDPVPATHTEQLAELMVWLYGKKSAEIAPVVQRQNPDLSNLRDVISKPIALDALRSGYSLERSFSISIGDERRFREALVRAKQEVQQAKATVDTGYNGDQDSYDRIEDIQQVVKSLQKEMKGKYDRASRQ
jgi:hypothetical protein